METYEPKTLFYPCQRTVFLTRSLNHEEFLRILPEVTQLHSPTLVLSARWREEFQAKNLHYFLNSWTTCIHYGAFVTVRGTTYIMPILPKNDLAVCRTQLNLLSNSHQAVSFLINILCRYYLSLKEMQSLLTCPAIQEVHTWPTAAPK